MSNSSGSDEGSGGISRAGLSSVVMIGYLTSTSVRIGGRNEMGQGEKAGRRKVKT